MKKFRPLFFVILMFSSFLTLNAQTYEKSMRVKDFGSWDKVVSPANQISISSYVTKQKIFVRVLDKIQFPQNHPNINMN